MKNIVLIGMSGAGKTTVGKYLSLKLNREFINTDDMIVLNTGYTIKHIFSEYGEEYFRHLENQIISKLESKRNLIISTGGGVILNKPNMDILKKNGIIFFLNADIKTLIKNIKKTTESKEHRPLLDFENLYDSINNLYNNRKELYFSNADFIIQINNKSIKEIGEEIIKYF